MTRSTTGVARSRSSWVSTPRTGGSRKSPPCWSSAVATLASVAAKSRGEIEKCETRTAGRSVASMARARVRVASAPINAIPNTTTTSVVAAAIEPMETAVAGPRRRRRAKASAMIGRSVIAAV